MNLYILGATGSIGTSTIEVLREHQYRLVAFSSGENIERTIELIEEFHPELVSVMKEQDARELSVRFPNLTVVFGEVGLNQVSKHNGSDGILVNALVGFTGLEPTISAIEAGKTIALANKETLVVAGELVMNLAKEKNVKILPVDSEHSAILQCIGNHEQEVKEIIITASGGSFRDQTREELVNVTVKEALSHPNWSMGAKITIDSATMMNKGFEVIEAHHLFGISYEKIKTVLHKESFIHSLVQFQDGSLLAQLGEPDMKLPISYALHYPKHKMMHSNKLDLFGKTLHFEELSTERFPLLALAYEVGRAGGILPCVLNAANEVAVEAFLNGKIKFLEIETVVFAAVRHIENEPVRSLEQLKQVNKDVRETVLRQLEN